MKDNRSKYELYKAASKRLVMWNMLSRALGLVLVTEFPKSGASWLCQMLADASNIPFPRNTSPKLQRCIMHGHHLFVPRMYKAIAVLRDGRDIMVSAYFHFLFDNDHNQSSGVRFHRSKLQFKDYNDVKTNMPRFIEYMFLEYPRKNRFHFGWSDFVENIYQNQGQVCIIKYEQLLTEPLWCLKNALQFYAIEYPNEDFLRQIVDRYSFKNIAKRKPGDEDRKSFVRKGISGDWKNYFSQEACEVFCRYGGKALIQAEYEKDANWLVPRESLVG